MAYTDPTDQAAYAKQHYARNKARYIARAKAHSQAQRKLLREICLVYKKAPCTDCERKYPTCVMDFDHIRGEKDRAVAVMANAGVSEARLLAEIEKCEIVCANCHRIRTEERRQAVGSR